MKSIAIKSLFSTDYLGASPNGVHGYDTKDR